MSHVVKCVADQSCPKNQKPKQGPTSTHVILSGVAKLLEGQRCFAEEFGLSYPTILHPECEVFRQRKPETIIREWFQDKTDGPQKFSRLIEDLVEHNLALCAALDGVAQESINRLSPAAVKSKGLGIFGWRPFSWLTFRRLHRSFQNNDYLRHQEIVVKGFAKAYSFHREVFRSNRTNPNNNL
jgi:hypothetical protein